MTKISTSILYYLKYPNTPILDYYIDVNGNYVYLAEDEVHTWTTGEKDSSGNTKTTGDADYISLTTEMEWKDQDKIDISHRILRTMGVEIGEKEVFEYAQKLKSE
jgi:thymidylate synthase